MRYCIFSDVHSNLEAFEAVVNCFKSERVDRYIFLGDIVGYGANPIEVINILKSLNPACVCGNHDLGVLEQYSLERFNNWAKAALIWTGELLDRDSADYLKTFSLNYETNSFSCVHGSLNCPADFNYIEDVDIARSIFYLLNKEILFVGHTHKAEIYFLEITDEQEPYDIFYTADQTIVIEPRNKYIVNVGSVGQPRDGDQRACYCIYDSDDRTVTLKRVNYDISKASEKIIKAGLPSFLADRLHDGR